jgi:hypothetical protein
MALRASLRAAGFAFTFARFHTPSCHSQVSAAARLPTAPPKSTRVSRSGSHATAVAESMPSGPVDAPGVARAPEASTRVTHGVMAGLMSMTAQPPVTRALRAMPAFS